MSLRNAIFTHTVADVGDGSVDQAVGEDQNEEWKESHHEKVCKKDVALIYRGSVLMEVGHMEYASVVELMMRISVVLKVSFSLLTQV